MAKRKSCHHHLRCLYKVPSRTNKKPKLEEMPCSTDAHLLSMFFQQKLLGIYLSVRLSNHIGIEYNRYHLLRNYLRTSELRILCPKRIVENLLSHNYSDSSFAICRNASCFSVFNSRYSRSSSSSRGFVRFFSASFPVTLEVQESHTAPFSSYREFSIIA